MIKQIRPAFYHNKRDSQYCCLSTDIIPDYLENGDEVYFIDTGKKYVYDSVSGQLYEKQSGGGGGTSVYPYNNNPEALGQEANPGTSDNYSRGDHIHPLPSVSDLGALPVGNIANEFSTSSTYAVGDYVIYEGQLYQCTTAVTIAGSWNSSNWVQAVLGNDVGDLKSALDTIVRSGAVNDTASGSIASFADGADNIPVKDLTVAVEPAQDLHGYDNPWPAGGGVNLLDPAKCSAVGQGGAYGLTVTHDQATAIWTISGTPTSQAASLSFNFCTYSDFSLSGKGYQVQAFPISGTPIKNLYGFRNEAENRIAIIIDTVANPTVNMTFKVSVAATAQTAWSPYSNICPISGWTGANVTRTGKNLLDPTTFSSRSNYYDVNDDGSVKIKASDTSGWNSAPIIPLKAGTYTLSINDYTSGNYQVETSEDNYVSPTHKRYDAAFTFTLTKDGGIKVKMGTGGATLPQTVKPMLNIGYTTASYSPYSGDTYSITFPSEAGTVYSGTLDVTMGKLTVDRAMVDLGAKNWYPSTSAGRTRFRTSITDIERISSPNVRSSLLCSNYPTKTANQTYQGTIGVSLQQNSADIYIYDPQMESMTGEEFKSAMSGVQLVYKLATPIVYDLTPTEVTTLLAQNNIWADCGDSTVNYRADTKLYIDKKITAPASPASGQYLSWNGSAWVAASLPVYNGGVS